MLKISIQFFTHKKGVGSTKRQRQRSQGGWVQRAMGRSFLPATSRAQRGTKIHRHQRGRGNRPPFSHWFPKSKIRKSGQG
jgi:hypothetical protein